MEGDVKVFLGLSWHTLINLSQIRWPSTRIIDKPRKFFKSGT